MADDFGKLWLQQRLNALAAQMATLAIQGTGRALPCIVTAVNPADYGYGFVEVKFEVQSSTPQAANLPPIVIPKAESQWLRAPTQVGDVGITQPADASIAGISGLGNGVAQIGPGTDQGNLTNLVFVPVQATSFTAPPDPNKAWINGPNGVVVSDSAQLNSIVVDADPSITSTVTPDAAAQALGATQLQAIIDGVANKITHSLTNSSGTVQTIVDGAGNAIAHVVPTGGLIGLGELPSLLGSARAAAANADLDALANGPAGIVNQTLVNLMSTVGLALGASSSTWGTAKTALQAIFTAGGFISGISGINPTVPGCSATVRLKP